MFDFSKVVATTLVAAGLYASTACVARSDSITTPFNTGVNASGGITSRSAVDLHYTLVSNTGGDASTVLYNSNYQNSVSSWISPNAGGAGSYDFQTTFSLYGLDPTTALLTGQVGGNFGGTVLLNGVRVGAWTNFGFTSFNTATAVFNNGVNTLDFIVDDTNGGTNTLSTVLTGTAAADAANVNTDVPEPSSLAILAASLFGFFGLRRRFGSRHALLA